MRCARERPIVESVAQKVQELLHECKTAMTLKELEKKASSEKGVVSNTVKEIVDELIADGLVWCAHVATRVIGQGGLTLCSQPRQDRHVQLLLEFPVAGPHCAPPQAGDV